jgi:diaminopimelate epimerase
MDIEFIKLQSCGNDFIVVDTFKNTILHPQVLPDLATQVCSRRFGVGALGLLLIIQGKQEKLRMLLYDPDGRERGHDGLALRCLARYAFDSGLATAETFSVEIDRSTEPVEVLDSVNVVTVGGPPRAWEGERILKERPKEQYLRTIDLGGRSLNYLPVFVQGAHTIILAGDYGLQLPELIEALAGSKVLRESADISLLRVISRDEVSLRTWQAGKGEILGSESAAAAAVVAAVLQGFTDREVQVHLEGGNLFIEWAEKDNLLYVSGPAVYVFMGTYYYEEARADEEQDVR